jgi:hypothetical protein
MLAFRCRTLSFDHEIQIQLTYMLVSVYVIYYFVLVLINGQ